MDMSCGYRTYVQECLPNAIIVIDRFHVCQSVYEKIAKARSKIMAYIGAVLTALRGGEYCGHFAEGDRE